MFPWKLNLGGKKTDHAKEIKRQDENPWIQYAPKVRFRAKPGEGPDIEPQREPEPEEAQELARIPLPDLLSPRDHAEVDHELLATLFELAFLGKDEEEAIEEALEESAVNGSTWGAESFSNALFVDDLVIDCLRIEHHGRVYPMHKGFIAKVLASPPCDLDSISFRQAIMAELMSRASVREAAQELHRELHRLISLFKASRDDSRLSSVSFRLDILRQARVAIDLMVDSFTQARSGLIRLHDVGLEIQGSRAYKMLTALLDHHDHAAVLTLEARVGGGGRLRHLAITGIEEDTTNIFHRSPLQRWYDSLILFLRHFSLEPSTIVDRLVLGVWMAIAPAIRSLTQVLCQLELYLGGLGFAELARARGLEVCLPEIGAGKKLQVDDLFNPLLISIEEAPVPCRLETPAASSISFVTGPNSGGKTRLLQALGLTQMLGQSGLPTPCSRARLPLCHGLYASITAPNEADQVEGRLGSELLRVRSLLETAPPSSLILLDELCSGTNPSEAIEIVTMVLRLLHELRPVAFITTHFLDFARQLEVEPPVPDMRFLQVEIDDSMRSTYQFVPGVAATSMAAATARRLGVTFEELLESIQERINQAGIEQEPEAEPENRPEGLSCRARADA